MDEAAWGYMDYDLDRDMDEPNQHLFTDPDLARKYILAGKAIITCVSERTGKHITFRIRSKADRMRITRWFVRADIGNTSRYITWLLKDAATGLILVQASPGYDALRDAYNGFCFITKHLLNGNHLPPQMKIYHHNTCGRCGRVLTNPQSIQSGIGPECAMKE